MVTKGSNQIFLCFLIFILLVGRPSYSQTDKLQQGQLLKDGDELHSAYGNFRLGFFTPESSTKRYLGIWYHKPLDRLDGYFGEERSQPVWVANRTDPVLDNSGRLGIDTTDGNLKIFHNGGDPIAISSIQAAGNTTAILEKSGNFVLYEMNSNGSIKRQLWQSFDYPTDTLLPGMKLGINLQTQHKWFLQSWVPDQSPEGVYTLGLDLKDTKKLVILSRNQVEWTSEEWLTSGRFTYSSPLASDYYNPLASYYYNFSYTSNQQEVYFNYSVNEDVTSFPALKIDVNGELLMDDSGITIKCVVFGGCVRRLICEDIVAFRMKHGFMSREGFKFKESDNMTVADCQAKCLEDCSCTAYASTNTNNNTGCEIWSVGTEFSDSYGYGNRRIYLKYGPRFGYRPWVKFIFGVAGALVALLLFFLFYRIRRKYKATEEKWWQSLGVVLVIPLLCYLCYLMLKTLKNKVESIWNRWKLLRELGDNVSVSLPTTFGRRKTKERDQTMKHELKIFDFQLIAAATDNFSTTNKLGQGGFGPVYKGKLPDGQEIAIKRLSRSSGQGIVEFKNEAKLIAKLQHTNLVRLLGCSLHGGERFLVYEYMPNKSLDFFLFGGSDEKNILNLKKRLSIIEGIAQGLIYLHKYSRLKVIHRDLKASNILLDDQMNPKISDFGMARAFGMNELEANTNRIVGTHGYMSPEYVMNGIVSTKTDVYSFGVMVLEIVSCKKNNSCYDTERPLNLVGFAWQLWNEGRGLELIDEMDESCSRKEVLRFLHVGLLCVQDRATDRPTISEVVSMLTNETILLSAPKQPAFFINISSDIEPPEVPENKLENCSTNNITISVMEAR